MRILDIVQLCSLSESVSNYPDFIGLKVMYTEPCLLNFPQLRGKVGTIISINKYKNYEVDFSPEKLTNNRNWICSNYPNAKIGIIFNDFTNIHPYHRYVFDYYKKIYFSVKPL